MKCSVATCERSAEKLKSRMAYGNGEYRRIHLRVESGRTVRSRSQWIVKTPQQLSIRWIGFRLGTRSVEGWRSFFWCKNIFRTNDELFQTTSGTSIWKGTKKQMSWQKKSRPWMEGSWRKFERRTSNKKDERFNAAVGCAVFWIANVEERSQCQTHTKKSKDGKYRVEIRTEAVISTYLGDVGVSNGLFLNRSSNWNGAGTPEKDSSIN